MSNDCEKIMTEQLQEWGKEFGNEYTKRNLFTAEEVDNAYLLEYGVTRTSMNKLFLDLLDRDIKILEVGTNIGLQLNLLSKLGFKNLYGIEINPSAIEISHKINESLPIYIIKASAFDIPFKDDFFDLVYTSGVLIHIHPNDISSATKEIYRCTNKYIWCFEYFAREGYKEIIYRGKSNLLWKTDFKKVFFNNFPKLTLIKEQLFPYKNEPDLIDQMFLLEKNK
jgi:pseudaminic acid biosynthesis-associated methylase